jgi:murein L,D-transpeptidase YcbB/YkuD
LKVITRFLAGAASAALLVLSAPASAAAASPELPAASIVSPAATQAVNAFYARRGNAPLWLRGGEATSAARDLTGILERAPLDGLDSGPALAAQAQALMARASAGDAAAAAAADRLLSAAWVSYVDVQRPPSGMIFADAWVAPRRDSPIQILQRAAAAPSLASYVRSVSQVNPLYAQLRDAAWAAMQSNGGALDPRVLTSLDRARERPFQHKYVMVDAAGARLYMIEDGRIVDSMRVVVGKAGPHTQTPMLASTIYYATLNPYWHVSPELVRSLTAKNVLDQGIGYLTSRGYQVLPADGSEELLDPKKVDWRAVADGSLKVRVRQLPGPANSMGEVKFGFPNAYDIYLHDTPVKALFSEDDRDLSHGCIRLENAEALARWMMGRNPQARSDQPELHVELPTPVPIYITYLTAQAHDGQLSFVDDIYGRDGAATEVAALR